MPRPNLEYNINQGPFSVFSVSIEKEREGKQNRTQAKRKIMKYFQKVRQLLLE
jgi:hypothetical protein